MADTKDKNKKNLKIHIDIKPILRSAGNLKTKSNDQIYYLSTIIIYIYTQFTYIIVIT